MSNGTIDLRSGLLRHHDPNDLITKIAPVDYDPAADAPVFQACLERVLPDPEVRMFLQQYAGYSLTGDITEQVIVIFHGNGANAKSTILRVLQDMLGDYARSAEPELLLVRGGSHPTGVADLLGARMVVSSEIGDGRRLAEATVKQLTGGYRIKARFMRQDFFEFAPTHKMWVAANHRPEIRGTDFAIWRRVLIVPFTVTIPHDEQDRHLLERLQQELPGILRWAVDGCLMWQRQGLSRPNAIMEATDSYRAEQDIIAAFLSDRCIMDDGCCVSAADIFRAYTGWAQINGESVVSQKQLGQALTEKGLHRGKLGTERRYHWFGVQLLGTHEPIRTQELNGRSHAHAETSDPGNGFNRFMGSREAAAGLPQGGE